MTTLIHAETHGKVGYQGRSLHEFAAEGGADVLLQLLNINTSVSSFASMAHHTVNLEMMTQVCRRS